MQRVTGLWLDAHDLHAGLVPCGDAADEAAAAHGDEQRIEPRCLLFQFAGERPLAFERCLGIIGMDAGGAACRDPAFAQCQRLGIIRTLLHHFGTIGGNARNLGGRRDFRNEDLGPVAELP